MKNLIISSLVILASCIPAQIAEAKGCHGYYTTQSCPEANESNNESTVGELVDDIINILKPKQKTNELTKDELVQQWIKEYRNEITWDEIHTSPSRYAGFDKLTERQKENLASNLNITYQIMAIDTIEPAFKEAFMQCNGEEYCTTTVYGPQYAEQGYVEWTQLRTEIEYSISNPNWSYETSGPEIQAFLKTPGSGYVDNSDRSID